MYDNVGLGGWARGANFYDLYAERANPQIQITQIQKGLDPDPAYGICYMILSNVEILVY